MQNVRITPAQVVTVLQHHEQSGATFASFRLSCPVKLLKKSRADKSPCNLGEVVKHSHLSVIINFDYESNVRAQRAREGKPEDFAAEANWFEHVSKAVVRHRTKGELYAYVRVQRNLSEPVFTCDGVEIERAAVVPFLPADDLTDDERRAAGLGADLGSPKQNLLKEVQPIAIKLANVREIITCETCYTLTAEGEEVAPEAVTVTTTARAPYLLGHCDCKPSEFVGVDEDGDCTQCGRAKEGAKPASRKGF